MSENKNTHENADLLKRLRHIAGLDAENYGALPEDAAEWKAADLIETITKQRDELLDALERFMDSHEECTDFDGFAAQIVSMADYHQAQEAQNDCAAAIRAME